MSLTITTIEELKKIAQGQIVELQGWEEGVPFVARIRRPSIQVMCANGQIPNSLLGAASHLFTAGDKVLEKVSIADLTKIQLSVAKATLIEPSYEDLEAAEIQLTDAQLSELFQYAMMGASGLESFREEQKRLTSNKSSKSVQGKTK